MFSYCVLKCSVDVGSQNNTSSLSESNLGIGTLLKIYFMLTVIARVTHCESKHLGCRHELYCTFV